MLTDIAPNIKKAERSKGVSSCLPASWSAHREKVLVGNSLAWQRKAELSGFGAGSEEFSNW